MNYKMALIIYTVGWVLSCKVVLISTQFSACVQTHTHTQIKNRNIFCSRPETYIFVQVTAARVELGMIAAAR